MSPNTSNILLGVVVVASFSAAVAVGLGWRPAAPRAYAADATSGSERKLDKASEPGGGTITIRVFNQDGVLGDPVTTEPVRRSEGEWQKLLSPAQFKILRTKGTELSCSGALLENKREGVYTCAGCKLPLFESGSKFDSGTGWPSFFRPLAKENITEERDISFGMARTEVLCTRCGGHLGHVFDDGPNPTGLRYCMNSEAMLFTDKSELKTLAEDVKVASAKADPAKENNSMWLPLPSNDLPLATDPGRAKAVFAGGCFWCSEAVFQELDGVLSVVSGYTGGDAKQANYKAVCTGTTGHAESIEITYDPSKITYGALLRVFFTTHDPTSLNRQGADEGTQYRSAIFYHDDAEKERAAAYIAELNASGKFERPIVTTLEKLDTFYEAEDYHQDYVKHNPDKPYIVYNALPKVKKLHKMLDADKEAKATVDGNS